MVFEGELLTTGQGIVVGSSLTSLHFVWLPIGWHPVRIYADPPVDPGPVDRPVRSPTRQLTLARVGPADLASPAVADDS